MKLSLSTKILIVIGLVGILCTGSATFLASRELKHEGEKGLLDKSQAILSRIAVGAKYVAQMNTLDGIIEETKQLHPNGKISEEQKLKVLKSVPIYAAFQIGKEGAAEENYQFRIASDAPRNKDNQATAKELEVINKFKANPELDQLVYESEDGNYLNVVRPVRINAKQNCLACHGNPANSPWGNGKDILGYRMENMEDGEMRATFAIVSDLKPVQKAIAASTKDILTYGALSTLLSLLFAYLALRSPIGALTRLSTRVGESSLEINSASDSLSQASQELASSSQEQASSVEEVSSSLEQISGMVTSSVKNSQESVEQAHRVADLVHDGTSSMFELQESVQMIAEANARVEALAKLIEEIGEKTELIDEIVFQTRLLSFNASVEAERAGEHGRGFAVVAQEVGNLAQMSGKSATEISQIVKNSIKEAQEVVQLSKNRVEKGVNLCQQTASQLKAIDEAAKTILRGAEQILRSSEEQNTGVREINQSINLISRATQENASAAEECSASSQAMMEQGENLNDVVQELEKVVLGAVLQKKVEKKSPPSRDKNASIGESKKILKWKPKLSANAASPKSNGSAALAQDEDPWEKL